MYPYLLRHLQIDRTNQDSQFTSALFNEALGNRDIKISMDDKGSWRDNVCVERIWRSIKYEEIYLHAYDSVSEARAGTCANGWLLFLRLYFSYGSQNQDYVWQNSCVQLEVCISKRFLRAQ